MDSSLLIGFISASAILALMPGPDNIYVLTESVSRGWRQGVGITFGLVSGVLIHTFLAATGLSLLVFGYPGIYAIVSYAGAIYLLYLAYAAIREKPLRIRMGATAQSERLLPLFRRGFIMNVLNPKVSIFFIAFLPQFVAAEGWTPMLQMMFLGLMFMMVSLVIFSGIAVLSGTTVGLVVHPLFHVFTKWVKVIVLVMLAVFLAVS